MKGTLKERFDAKYEIDSPYCVFEIPIGPFQSETMANTGEPCWLWTGAKTDKGYGQIKDKGKMRRAHVVSLELAGRPRPDGLETEHLCRVRHCTQPAHLEWVTHAENVRRGDGGKNHADKVACPQGHPYEGDNLYVNPSGGWRQCRACNNAGGRKDYAANREERARRVREYRAANRDEYNRKARERRAARAAE